MVSVFVVAVQVTAPRVRIYNASDRIAADSRPGVRSRRLGQHTLIYKHREKTENGCVFP